MTYHKDIDGIVDDGILKNLDRIKIYPITITSEEGLTKEIARISNLSMALGYINPQKVGDLFDMALGGFAGKELYGIG